MLIYVALFIIFVLLVSKIKELQPEISEKTGQELEKLSSAEFTWSIHNAQESLKDGSPKLTSPLMPFASHDWSLELQCVAGVVTVDLKKNDVLSAAPFPDMYWGVGVRRRDVAGSLPFWSEAKETGLGNFDWTCRKSWIGPRVRHVLRVKKHLLPDGMLTFFVRLSTHPAPIGIKRENVGGDNSCFKGATEEDYSTHKISDEKDERVSENLEVLSTLSKNLRDLYLKGDDHDVMIIVQGETFGAHQAILKARSPVLLAMFSHSMLEKEIGEIQVEDCDPEAFAIFLSFLYSGVVDTLSEDNVMPVYYTADKYDVPDLKKVCIQYMMSNLNVHTVSRFTSLALMHGEQTLLEKATGFFMIHAKKIFPTVEWQKFLKQNATQANELVIKCYAYEKD